MALALDDSYWYELHTPFGDARGVPALVRTWQTSVGRDTEEEAYTALFEHYLHQLSISSCSYAVVPHVVSQLHRCTLPRQIELLGHIATVELERPRSVEEVAQSIDARRVDTAHLSEDLQESMVDAVLERAPLLPKRLENSYFQAIETARIRATDLLRAACTPTDFARLLGAITALFAPRESVLARALMQPDGLWIEAEFNGQASIQSLLSDANVAIEQEE